MLSIQGVARFFTRQILNIHWLAKIQPKVNAKVIKEFREVDTVIRFTQTFNKATHILADLTDIEEMNNRKGKKDYTMVLQLLTAIYTGKGKNYSNRPVVKSFADIKLF